MDDDRLEEVRHEYYRLEDALNTIAEYIPFVPDLDAPNYKIASPRTAQFGLDCCTWVETLLKELILDPMMDGRPGIEEARKAARDNPSIDVYRHLEAGLGGGYSLRGWDAPLIEPFREWELEEEKNPEWFRVYSKLKHDRFGLAQSFTMGHAVNAFVALTIVVNKFVGSWPPTTRTSRILASAPL